MVGTNVMVSNSVWLTVLVVPFLIHSFSVVGMNVMSNGNQLKVLVVPFLMHSLYVVGMSLMSQLVEGTCGSLLDALILHGWNECCVKW
jgi:hypothetical protein